MRILYKTLTVVVLSGLVCYTGRKLNLQEKNYTPTAEQSILQVRQTTAAIQKTTQIHQKGDVRMQNQTRHNLNRAK